VVVVPLHRAFGAALLSRMLLYTAITRAKRLLIVVGSGDVLAAAAGRNQGGRKLTRLADRLGRVAAREGLLRLEPRVFREEDGGAAEDGVGDEEL